MRIKKTEYGVELIAESGYEQECLRHLRQMWAGKFTIQFEDDWDSKGCLKLEGEPHPWDKR